MNPLHNQRSSRIAVLLPKLGIGGAEKLVFSELKYLKENYDINIELHAINEGGLLLEDFISIGIPVTIWNAPNRNIRSIYYLLKLILHIKRNNITTLHCHLHWWGAWIGLITNINSIITVHSTKISSWQKFNFKFHNTVFCCGQEVFQKLKYVIPKKKLVGLPNAVPQPDYNKKNELIIKDSVRKEMGIEANHLIILSIGRLCRIKGFDVLLNALQLICNHYPKIYLLIAGDGPERAQLEQQAFELNLIGNIRFLGFVKNVSRLYIASDIYVNSSRHEGLSMTLLEALSHRKCIIATSIKENTEIIKEGLTGILAPPDQPSLLADAILTAIKDDKLRYQLGENGYIYYTNNYSIENHCKSLIDFYK